MIDVNIKSETDLLKAVLIHEPGPEVESMTPATAERALYSDILNLPLASKEYGQFKQVLKKITKVYEVRNLLTEVLKIPKAKRQLIDSLVKYSRNPGLSVYLENLSEEEFGRQILEGIPFDQKSLANFLNKEKYTISPLHNIFFTRDATFVIGRTVFISAMARRVREPETFLMQTLFEHHPDFKCNIVPLNSFPVKNVEPLTVEGGDIIVAGEGVLIVGIGSRTTARGIDNLLHKILEYEDLKYVIAQELPDKPESFIHLDMVFTLLTKNESMVYEPLVLGRNKYHTVVMSLEKRQVKKIDYVENILAGLKITGIDMQPLICGGRSSMFQEREQWHSGANFLAFAPGQIIGYERNVHTSEELSQHGYRVIPAPEFYSSDGLPQHDEKILITIPGSELSRGGGGARCMSMPLLREY